MEGKLFELMNSKDLEKFWNLIVETHKEENQKLFELLKD